MTRPTQVSLFVTCLVDALQPPIGIATVTLLERLGFAVDFPAQQVCCGQPALNTGYPAEARTVARPLLDAFADSESVVCPSGSCAAMIRHHLPELFANDARLKAQAEALAKKTYELSEFLVRVAGINDTGSRFDGTVAYHPSCHLSREMGVVDEPLQLLRAVKGLTLVTLANAEECCGFGGTFSVKHGEISSEMVCDKADAIEQSGADAVVSCDSGCLMNITGVLTRRKSTIRTLHLAEILETPS